MSTTASIPIIDFAVVGGGIAGTYSAWRLAKAFPGKVVHLFEATSRVGGRLLTASMPGLAFNAELGGMRYTDRQLLIANLANVLRLTSKPFEFETCLLFLRGSHFGASGTAPYKVDSGEMRKSAPELILHAIRRALRDVVLTNGDKDQIQSINEQFTRLFDPAYPLDKILNEEQWSVVKHHAELHGAPLYEIGFWNLLQFYLSSEGFLYAHDGLGYESILANWNAAEAIPWFLRDFNVQYKTIEGGMDRIPTALYFEFEKERPDSQHLRHTLIDIEQTIVSNGDKIYKLRFGTEAEQTVVTARNVILALPKIPLMKMRLCGFRSGPAHPMGDSLVELDFVTEQPLFKLFLGYPKAWWKDPRGLGCEFGRACTDLPIRQVYYFTVNSPSSGEHTSASGGVLMASYNDAHYVDFWKPLHRRGTKPAYYGGNLDALTQTERGLLQAYGASEKMVSKAQRQVRLLHPELSNTDSIPDPYVGMVMEWSDQPPYYYGWHTWKVHTRPWQVIHALTKPFPESNLFICGEAYSNEQGWAEGALRSTELVLKQLGLQAPKWVNTADYEREGFRDFEQYIGISP